MVDFRKFNTIASLPGNIVSVARVRRGGWGSRVLGKHNAGKCHFITRRLGAAAPQASAKVGTPYDWIEGGEH